MCTVHTPVHTRRLRQPRRGQAADRIAQLRVDVPRVVPLGRGCPAVPHQRGARLVLDARTAEPGGEARPELVEVELGRHRDAGPTQIAADEPSALRARRTPSRRGEQQAVSVRHAAGPQLQSLGDPPAKRLCQGWRQRDHAFAVLVLRVLLRRVPLRAAYGHGPVDRDGFLPRPEVHVAHPEARDLAVTQPRQRCHEIAQPAHRRDAVAPDQRGERLRAEDVHALSFLGWKRGTNSLVGGQVRRRGPLFRACHGEHGGER